MSKVPATTTDTANDLGNRVQGYFEQLETERRDLRRELELARTQNTDLDKNLAMAEHRAERAEQQRDQALAQRDDALQKLVALSTLWGSIKSAVGQGEAMITQTAHALKQPLGGAPRRPIEALSLGKVAEVFNESGAARNA